MDVNKLIEEVVYKDATNAFLRILETGKVDIKPETITCKIYIQPDIDSEASLCSVRLSCIDSEGNFKHWDYSRYVRVT